MKKNKNINVYILFLIITVIFLLITVSLYNIQFGQNGFSNKTQDWANFGSYFGGVLSPIITSITLIFLFFQIKNSNESTETQIKHMQDTREIETIINEINNLSSFIFDMMTEVRVMPKKNIIEFCEKNGIGGEWINDYNNKLVSFPEQGTHGKIISWNNVIIYLKSILELNNEKDTQLILHDYEYNPIYTSISSLLGHLVHHCYKLAKIDMSSYDFIRTKLSLFTPSIYYLNKAKFFQDEMVDHINYLQSLSLSPSKDNFSDLKCIFSNELKIQNFIDEEVDDIEVTGLTKDSHNGQINKYRIKCKGKNLERNLGIWNKIDIKEEV